MLCPACNEDVHPYGQFSLGKGTQYRCPKCNGGMPKPEEYVVSTGKGTIAVLPVAPPAPVTVEPTATPAAQSTKPTESRVDVLALAKERLATVNEMIENLRAYEAEQALLRRMIEAAEPTAPVIALRAKQG